MAEKNRGDFISSDWLEPHPELRLVDGVWKPVVKWVPPSSSRKAGKKLPRSMREKMEWEEAEKAAEEAKAAEEGSAEDEATQASDETTVETGTSDEAPAVEPEEKAGE